MCVLSIFFTNIWFYLRFPSLFFDKFLLIPLKLEIQILIMCNYESSKKNYWQFNLVDNNEYIGYRKFHIHITIMNTQ